MNCSNAFQMSGNFSAEKRGQKKMLSRKYTEDGNEDEQRGAKMEYFFVDDKRDK